MKSCSNSVGSRICIRSEGLWDTCTGCSNAFINLTEFEGQRILDANAAQREYEDYYSDFGASRSTFFRNFLDRELAAETPFPTQQASHLVSIFEARRLKGTEIVAIIVSALLGGAVGALLTTGLTSLLH